MVRRKVEAPDTVQHGRRAAPSKAGPCGRHFKARLQRTSSDADPAPVAVAPVEHVVIAPVTEAPAPVAEVAPADRRRQCRALLKLPLAERWRAPAPVEAPMARLAAMAAPVSCASAPRASIAGPRVSCPSHGRSRGCGGRRLRCLRWCAAWRVGARLVGSAPRALGPAAIRPGNSGASAQPQLARPHQPLSPTRPTMPTATQAVLVSRPLIAIKRVTPTHQPNAQLPAWLRARKPSVPKRCVEFKVVPNQFGTTLHERVRLKRFEGQRARAPQSHRSHGKRQDHRDDSRQSTDIQRTRFSAASRHTHSRQEARSRRRRGRRRKSP